MLKITNIYDNIPCDSKFKSDWGFGCVIDYKNTRIIFDTGAKSEVLKSNLQTAKIDPSSIDFAIISHKHWDHKGGAAWLLNQNPKIKIFAPKTLFRGLDKSLDKVNFVSKNLVIKEKFYLIISKNLLINEIALVIETSKGLAVISGCSHTGIQNIASKAAKYLDQDIYLLYGGFHLFKATDNDLQKFLTQLKKLKVKKVAPSHCTGKKAFNLLKQEFGDNYIVSGCGSQLILA